MKQQCHNHSDRLALSFCNSCNRFFCSECLTDGEESYYCLETSCQIQRQREISNTPSIQSLPSEERFAAAIDKPIRTGWSLWWKLNPYLLTRLALPIGFAYWIASQFVVDASSEDSLGILRLSLLVCFGAVALAVTSAALSQRYREYELNPWKLALSRFGPWLFTTILATAATFVGLLLFIVPGIIVAIRLFWADELALAHNLGPTEAIRQSWVLTRDRGWNIFGFQFLLGLAEYAVAIPLFILFALLTMLLTNFDNGPLIDLLTVLSFSAFLVSIHASAHACEIVYFYALRAPTVQPQTLAHSPDSPACSHHEEFDNFCSLCGTDLRKTQSDFIGKRKVDSVIDCSHTAQSSRFCSNCGTRISDSKSSGGNTTS